MTGLLYVIVIVMWAAVLFPIFLKKHDQAQLQKSVGIKRQLTGLRWQQRVAPTARQQAFIRRRRVLMCLLTVTILSLLSGLSGIFSLLWSSVPVAFLLLFVFAAIKNGHKIAAISDVPVPTMVAPISAIRQNQETLALKLEEPNAVTEQSATWQPVEPPMPSYVRAERATSVPRALDSQKPWTGQDMVEHATRLRQQHAERIKEAQKRLEEARALSMEKARRAALSVRPGETPQDQTRAVNE